MSNQQGPVNRPWFRLAAMMRPPPPPQQPPPPEPLPPPRPAFIRPTFRAQPPPQQSTSPPPAPPSPQIVARTPPPTIPSPRTIGTTPPPPTAAASSSPSPQLPASNSSTIPSSPITKQPFPSFPSPKTTLSTPSPSPSPPPPSPSQSTIARPTTPPTFSPKTLGKTPPPSPNLKPPSHPPSPLTLPPPQLISDTEQKTRSPPVFEQKTVLVQETNQKPKASPKNFNMFKPTINTNNPKHDSPKKNMNHKKHLHSEDSGTVIITISGDNKGAIMELSPSEKPTELSHINAHKSGSNNSNETAKNKDQKAIPPPVTAFTNSNVQCVNNSIVFNCSMTHHDPGVHFSVSRKPKGHHGNHLKD